MNNLFVDIITHPAFGIITGLIGYLIGNNFALGRDRRKEFYAASDEFRKIFTQALVDIRDKNSLFDFYSIDKGNFKKLQVAYLNFRHFLKGACCSQYDEAWNQYDFDCKYQWTFDDSAREKVAKDIERLLEFTEYSLLRSMSFVFRETWWKIRFKLFGPDKETKELLKKFSTHEEPPKK